MKGILFLVLLTILGFIAYSYTSKEGFQSPALSQAGIVKVPKDSLPEPKAVEASSPAPYMPPADKEYGPAFGEVARVNTLPYRDPALETASYKRLAELRQDLAGFLGFEAKGLQDQGDPAIQLPLGTARGDFQRVSDEVDVLKRNPGLNSQLTLRDINDIQANLDYLRNKYRLSINSLSYDGSKEGFQDAPTRATLKNVEDALIRVKSEILRLSNSATTDPVTTSRVAVLTRISQSMNEIVKDVKSGARTPDQIPIMKKDLDEFLPVAGDPSKPIPKFLDEAGLPPILENLFPAYSAGDISGAKMASYLFNQYADTVVKGLSWNVGVKYTSPNEVAAASRGSSVGQTTGDDSLIPAMYSSVANTSLAGTSENVVGPTNDMSSPYTYARGEMEGCTNPSRNGSKPTEPAHYDWKSKSASICEAIRKRGLNPGDFGCLANASSVGPDYSWRGNARMVCTRLQSSLDTSLPEVCGCPPPEWAGWRA
jgi:hypothetical protein